MLSDRVSDKLKIIQKSLPLARNILGKVKNNNKNNACSIVFTYERSEYVNSCRERSDRRRYSISYIRSIFKQSSARKQVRARTRGKNKI